LKRILFFISISYSFAFPYYLKAQSDEKVLLFQRFLKEYKTSDLVSAERTLFQLIELREKLTKDQLRTVYNNLGATCTLLGSYNEALNYYNYAESLIEKNNNSKEVADIYINKAIILGYQKSYSAAKEYFEKGIRIYSTLQDIDKSVFSSIASAYLNYGIVFLETGDYKNALHNFTQSSVLKLKYKLSGLALVYLNLAKTYVKADEPVKAEEYFLKSFSAFKNEFDESYFRLAEVYFEYGLFLRSVGRKSEAREAHRKALEICTKNYGQKHSLISYSYKLIGDDYSDEADYNQALTNYQNSLMSIVNDFNDPDIFKNPSIDSSLFDLRLLDNLKSKAQALKQYAEEQKDQTSKLNIMTASLETIVLALRLIDRIRSNYLSEESRIYLAGNEKETYLFATQVAYFLYSMNKDHSTGYKMYSIAQKAKAAILRNEITGNELLYSSQTPDSLRVRQNRLTGNIAAYNNFILEESRKTVQDSNRIVLWKDALFDMNREKEQVAGEIEKAFPGYRSLIRRTEPDSLEQIQKNLLKDEIIIDYLLSNQYSDGKRRLYVFIISRDSLNFSEHFVDSLFNKNAEIIRNTGNSSSIHMAGTNHFETCTGALNYMYNNLIGPFEKRIKGTRLIIIPDEEISWLSFDAFLKNKPLAGQTDYEGLSYLVKDYTFSYAYSSSLISARHKIKLQKTRVFAFSPDYSNASLSGNSVSSLVGAGTEIASVLKWFRGKAYTGENATKSNFISALKDPAVLHLAMHSMSDSMNSKYSYLLFDTHKPFTDDGKLYNYEISLARINSPMVVLSACNSGTGTLYSGEGLMSLARGFMLAGASSVIKTSWEINDETSTEIITRFYYHLSRGKDKDVAMRLSKLEYLKKSSPEYTNPYYWAAYEVMGDTTPIAHRKTGPAIILILGVIIISGFAIIYLRRRKIFSERSR
jgi:CHAT domain-containing protein